MGILRTAATVAVASAVHGRVQRRQQERWAAQDQRFAPEPPVSAQQQARDAPPHVANPADMLAMLTQLGELRASGVLSEAEFAAQKARILNG
jgi:hypothetical protein